MNILLITSIYPIEGQKVRGGTSVCHYFAKEWKKQGHDVRVVNTYTVYTPLLHFIARFAGKQIASRFAASINTKRYSRPFKYEVDGIPVLLSPTYKPLPGRPFTRKALSATSGAIKKHFEEDGFTPDVIACHFLHPNIELAGGLKKIWPGTPLGITLHGQLPQGSGPELNQAARNVDFWGFRSWPIRKSFEKERGECKEAFMCFSGVPKEYVKPGMESKHNKIGVSEFVYVGNLSRRKHPATVAEALLDSGLEFHLEYIGDGDEAGKIRRLAQEKGKEDGSISLQGRMAREEVARKLEGKECFIMVSEAETFGLVYLEAMAKGCIVVASKGEGMEGIITDGVNGFLCEAGNRAELTGIIKKINGMAPGQKMEMGHRAIETASAMTDTRMADDYLGTLQSYAGISKTC